MRLRSRIDGWLAGILLSSIALLVAGLWEAHAQDGPLPVALALPILLLGAGLPLWILAGTHYTFVGDALVVRCGPFRLRIDYGAGRTLMVSPADKDAFLRELDRAR